MTSFDTLSTLFNSQRYSVLYFFQKGFTTIRDSPESLWRRVFKRITRTQKTTPQRAKTLLCGGYGFNKVVLLGGCEQKCLNFEIVLLTSRENHMRSRSIICGISWSAAEQMLGILFVRKPQIYIADKPHLFCGASVERGGTSTRR